MSPSSRPKTKSKASARAAKEQRKASTKPSGSNTSSTGSVESAYKPISGTLHGLDLPLAPSSPLFHENGPFRSIDDTDDLSSSSHGTGSEYDSVSNNGSCSGQSEDPKENITNSTRRKRIPGSDKDRREKIRLKNERKHRSQKERRAQELHERCCWYLMSRKLDALSQQLVALGFSSERAILALMLNDGRIEESVNWLFEGNEQEGHKKDTEFGSNGNLKIDISEELANISVMEVRYKCSKQEVERAIVACEGDLVKAEETLQEQKREPPAALHKKGEITDSTNLMGQQEKPAPGALLLTQQRGNERDSNHRSTPVSLLPHPELGNRSMQHLNQPKLLAGKRWVAGGSTSSFSSSMNPPVRVMPVPSSKLEARPGVSRTEETKSQRILSERIVMMPCPEPINAKQNPVPNRSTSLSANAGWYSHDGPVVDRIRSSGKLLSNESCGNFYLVNRNSEQLHSPASKKDTTFLSRGPMDSIFAGFGGPWSTTMGKSPITISSEPQSSYHRTSASLPPAAPSSLGLFAGCGSATPLGSSSHIDWKTGGLRPEFDYTNIDWSLDSKVLSSKPNGLWLRLSSLLRSSSGTRTSTTNGSCMLGSCDNGVAIDTSSSINLCEWTSPFAEKDIFALLRQFVTSPSPQY